MRRTDFWSLALFFSVLLGVAVLGYFRMSHPKLANIPGETYAIALLVPDDVNKDDPHVTAWLDVAAEVGLPVELVTVSDFLRPTLPHSTRFAGIILPDTIHKAASYATLGGLDAYVRNGGRLMVVYDAGTLTLPNYTYDRDKSRLSALVGIDYALYDQLRDNTIRRDNIFGSQETLLSLHIPPGKFYSTSQDDSVGNPFGAGPKSDMELSLFGYIYGMLQYSHFVTRGTYAGQTLLYTDKHETVAGVRKLERGQVLFVNLPLGYLKTRTDGFLLHAFLRYFGVDLVQMPFLSNVPNGLGGLVMNWHIDSNAALPALRKLKATKTFEQGPYSVHLTAGPDGLELKDGLGTNVLGNQETQKWLRFFVQRNYRVGSHGGWVHNYFGLNVNEINRREFEPYLRLNKEAIESITKQPVTEYSAPVGTHPQWVTDWLDSNNIFAYYFVGETGAGPTKPYRNDQRTSQKAWAFPVLNMGPYGTFEEMAEKGVPEQSVAEWLRAVTDFVTNDHCIRLIYAHPPGMLQYIQAFEAWLDHTRALKQAKHFSWYTMTDVASFLTAREKVDWVVTLQDNRKVFIAATQPVSLVQQNWRLAAERYEQPKVLQGTAAILRDGADWLVRAEGGQTLVLAAQLRMNQNQ
jgi:hypothetical protein